MLLFLHVHEWELCVCVCALSSWMWTECAWEGGTLLPEIPLTALDDSCAASLFIWTDATEPLVQLVQPLCSKARHCRVPLSLGKPWTSCAPSPSPTSSSDFSQNQKLTPPHLQVSNQSWTLKLRSCLAAMYTSIGVVNVSLDFQTAKRTSILMWNSKMCFFVLLCFADQVHLTDTRSACRVPVECRDKDHKVLQ